MSVDSVVGAVALAYGFEGLASRTAVEELARALGTEPLCRGLNRHSVQVTAAELETFLQTGTDPGGRIRYAVKVWGRQIARRLVLRFPVLICVAADDESGSGSVLGHGREMATVPLGAVLATTLALRNPKWRELAAAAQHLVGGTATSIQYTPPPLSVERICSAVTGTSMSTSRIAPASEDRPRLAVRQADDGEPMLNVALGADFFPTVVVVRHTARASREELLPAPATLGPWDSEGAVVHCPNSARCGDHERCRTPIQAAHTHDFCRFFEPPRPTSQCCSIL